MPEAIPVSGGRVAGPAVTSAAVGRATPPALQCVATWKWEPHTACLGACLTYDPLMLRQQGTILRPGDRAFVLTNLDFAAVLSSSGGSAWPAGTLGFDNDLTDETMAEFAAASLALLVRSGHGAAGGPGGSVHSAGAGSMHSAPPPRGGG
jgi:hypothetical protein